MGQQQAQQAGGRGTAQGVHKHLQAHAATGQGTRQQGIEPGAEGKAEGIFEIEDPNFGNLWTNIPLKTFREACCAYGDMLNVVVRHEGEGVFNEKVFFHQSFGMAKKDEPIIYNNELMKVALAVSQGSFIKKYGINFGPEWTVEFTK